MHLDLIWNSIQHWNWYFDQSSICSRNWGIAVISIIVKDYGLHILELTYLIYPLRSSLFQAFFHKVLNANQHYSSICLVITEIIWHCAHGKKLIHVVKKRKWKFPPSDILMIWIDYLIWHVITLSHPLKLYSSSWTR